MILHLIRHGQTRANEQHLYCGSTDLPLSDSGIAGIKALKEQGIYPSIDGLKVYTSGKLRAEQSLYAIYGDSLVRQVLPGFSEMDFGDFEMHSYEQLKQDPDYIAWIEDQTGTVPCRKGESKEGFVKRVFASFKALRQKGQSALLLCHGGVITCLMQGLFPEDTRNYYQWQPSPGEGYSIEFSRDGKMSFRAISKKPLTLGSAENP